MVFYNNKSTSRIGLPQTNVSNSLHVNKFNRPSGTTTVKPLLKASAYFLDSKSLIFSTKAAYSALFSYVTKKFLPFYINSTSLPSLKYVTNFS